MERSDMMPPPIPPGSFEINGPQYFTTAVPGQPSPTPHLEYYPQHMGPPMPPPPPLPEPHDTSNVSLDPMLQESQPPLLHAPPGPPPEPTQVQGSEAIIDAAKAERTAQDRERGRLRVQRFRMKRKLADAEAGKRDKETLKKIRFPPDETDGDADNGASPSTGRRGANAKDTEAEMRERERGRLRVQAYRMRKKLAEAKDGVRDPSTLKKIRSIKSGESTERPETPETYSPSMLPPTQDSIMHYAEPMFNVPVEAPSTMLPPPPLPSSLGPAGKPEPSLMEAPPSYASGSAVPLPGPSTASTSRQRAVRTNWFHPARWSTINAAGLRANFSSAHEIVRLAKLAPGGEETFKTLDRGTVHKWITKNRRGWTESVLEKVRKAAVKEAESWDARRLTGTGELGEGSVPGTSMDGGFGVPGMEGVSVGLVDGSGAVVPFEGNVGAGGEHEAAVMGGNA